MGLNRRALLQVGGLGLLGAGSAGGGNGAIASEAGLANLPQFGRAKRCILLYLFGAAPQHETFDPKPDAPAEIQGELKAISSATPGTLIGEGLPKTASVTDRLTIIRSMSHTYPLHGVAYALSGLPVYTTDLETRPRDAAQWPYFGSVADWYWSQGLAPGTKPPLQHVALPWVMNSQVDDLGLIAGPYGAFLGPAYDPVWTHYHGKGLRTAPKCRHEQNKEYQDPYAACGAEGQFTFAGSSADPKELADPRNGFRKALLTQFDQSRRDMESATNVRNYQSERGRVMQLLTAAEMRTALDLEREQPETRERYGYTLFGQSCLAARRLAEAGSRFISVFWDAYGTYFSGGWDTHQNHYPRLKEYLLPGFDAAFAALIRDLDERHLLDETLVICTTEHGRTPQIDSKPVGAARHHWSKTYCTVLAGGGTPRGAVVGASDKQGADVADCPISPKDVHATAFHLLGISPNMTMPDRQNRPHPIAGSGVVRKELLA